MIEREELKPFLSHEIETTRELMACADGPPTASNFARIILLMLRGHYGDPDNFGDAYDHLKCYFWNDTPDSSLDIDFVGNWNPDEPPSFPGIFVEYGQVTMERSSLANFAGLSASTAGTNVSKLNTLEIKVHHVMKTTNDAYDMADMSAMFITSLAVPTAQNCNATSIEVLGYGLPEKKTPSPDRYYDVAMTIQIKYNLRVARTLESHRLVRLMSIVANE